MSTEKKAMPESEAKNAPSIKNLDIEPHIDFTEDEEKIVIRKIDSVVLAMMCIVQFFQCEHLPRPISKHPSLTGSDLDKQSIGYAAVFNLSSDLGMDSKQYSWAVSSFYCGQFIAEYIFIYLMSRLPIVRFVGLSLIIWGLLAGALASPNNFGGFTAVRTLLGFAEGAVTPAFVIITSMWYKKSEHAIRTAGWCSFNGVAQILGALAMYGVGLADDIAIANWRLMFLLCGSGTLVAAALFLWLMPIGPDTAWFLNDRERHIAVQRLSAERLSKEQTSFSWPQIWEFAKDHRAWLLVLAAFFNTLASPVIKFATLVINGFGWSKLNTMLVSLPAGVIQIIWIWVVVLGIRYTKIPRSFWGIIATIPPLVGNVGVAALPSSSKWGVVVCTWLATVLSPFMVVILSLIASNIKGNTKKSAASNGYFIFYAAAAIAGPQLWTKGPRYTDGIITDLVSLGCNIVICVLFWLSGTLENRKRDKLNISADHPGDADVTDRQDMSFRYTV
ncbi:unnamed protein product [Clonostachys rosea f. rosea IK726]|uniref:Uncharacterized protein n=1 Tax=Clonostachys rosea f. rosea IK726 TaxID=1349383 RepID=A0ACA9UDZ7_BIOOC|nr:unnamed protein product [Clonostachys rosea f. rosea IK726]